MILIKGPTSVALPPKLILRQYLNIPHADKVDELVSATLKPVVIEGILVEFLQGYSFYRFDLSIYIEEFYSKTVRYVIVPPCKSSNLDVSFLFQSHHKFEFYVAKDKCSRWGFYDSSSLNEHGCKLFLKQIREKSSPIHLLVGMGSSPFSISDDQNIPKYLQSWLDYGVRLGIDIHSIRKNKNQNEETINFIRSQFLNYPFTIDIEEQYFSYLFEQYINTFFMVNYFKSFD